MLQTIREYGLVRLEESGESQAFHRRHAMFFAHLAEMLEREACAVGPGVVSLRAQRDWENLRAALEWSQTQSGETDTCLRLISPLGSLWAFGGHAAEGYARATTVLARPEVEQYPELWARALITMGALSEMRGETDRAVTNLERSETILRRTGDNAGLSEAVQWLGITGISRGDIEDARRRFAESRDLARAENLLWTEATALSFLAEVTVAAEDLDEVRAIAEEAEAQYRVVGDPWGLARVQKLLSGIAWVEGDYATAHRLCEGAIGPLRTMGERWNLARALTRMGVILFDEGQYEDAERTLTESLLMWRDMANEDGMILSLAGIVAVAAARGEREQAARLYAAEPFHEPERGISLDTLSMAEYRHLLEAIRTVPGDLAGGARPVPLQGVISEVVSGLYG
jgi:tetratricopeptide (TPR) repeat protein